VNPKEKEQQAMSNEKPAPKLGAGHLSAMGRLGLAELRAAAVFSESNIVQPAPYGIVGTKTPGEVQDDREASVREAEEQSHSVLDGRLEDADRGSATQEREPPQLEME
jgi:hypothetical protein